MSSWLTWISILINSIIPLISIQFLFKSYSKIIRNIGENSKQIVVNQQHPINEETVICERCKCAINKTTSSSAKNYHNKEQTKYQTLGDESFKRCGDDDGENHVLSSSDDDHNIIGQVSTREVISYVGNNDRQSENNKILEVCRTRNTVSKLRKQFEDGTSGKKKMRNIEKKISERFFKKEPSPIRNATKLPTETEDINNIDEPKTEEDQSNNDYYVIEKTKVYKVLNNNKENVKGAATGGVDKLSKLLLSKRSYSNGDIKRTKKSPSHNVIAEESIFPNERTNSCDNINVDSDDIEYRKISAGNNRRSVRTFDDILQQERFSKCYSEYSISDLLNDLPDDDDDIEFTSFFNKIK